jgi:single-strand DNA-binding protein
VGNVTRDPELKYTPGGQANVRFGIAVNRTWTDRNTNERKEQTSFFNVVVWGQLAENVSQSIGKGDRVVVTGRLEQRSYEKDGEKKEAIEVVADEVSPSLRWATAQVVRAERREAVDY